MILKNRTFDHSQEGFHGAMGIPKDTIIACRERIFFIHFANTLQSLELFNDRADAPRELTTVTGDLQRTLKMISDPLEYELTLIHFMTFHRLAQEAFAHWKFQNGSDVSSEDKLKLQLLNLLKKLKAASDKDEEDDDDITSPADNAHNDINIDSVMERIDVVKKSQYNFPKYMELLGFQYNQDFPDVDKIINGLFE